MERGYYQNSRLGGFSGRYATRSTLVQSRAGPPKLTSRPTRRRKSGSWSWFSLDPGSQFYSVKTVSFLAHLVDELRSGYPLDLFLKDGGSVEPGIVKGTINQV
jgi:hypothetical protein